MLKSVEKYVKAGFAVHLLKKKSKAPLLDSWSTAVVPDYEKLQRTYKDGMNLGVRLGKWSKVHGFYLHVVDLDIRDDDLADEALDALETLFPDHDEYPRVQSGSMGLSRHFYIVSEKPFASKKLAHSKDKTQTPDGKWHWGWEIELFGTGKQVVMPPSIHPETGKAYRWEQTFDPADLMFDEGPIVGTDVLELLTGSGDQDESGIHEERIKPLDLSEDEIRDIIARLPKDEWIDDRWGWLNIGMAVHHETGGSDEGFQIWIDCSKQSEKFDKKDQKRVWKSFKNRGRPYRMASLISAVREIELEDEIDNLGDDEGDDFDTGIADSEFPDLGPEPKDDDEDYEDTKRGTKLKKEKVEADLGNVPPKIKRLNKKHALAFVKGKTIVITEKGNGDADFGSLSELHNWYENVRVATEKSTEPVSKYWMRHKKRRQYPEGVGFYPAKDTPGMYNLWSGWSVEPDGTKSCDLILWHIKHIACNNRQNLYDYFIGWLADMVQNPDKKPGVAAVLRGRKGAGKDTIANYVGKMFEPHYMMINQQKHLTGSFNAHQEKLLLLHVEEGFWAGSKSDEGPLKSLITSEHATIERKGIDAFKVNSVLRIFWSSNENWVVPASEDERRFFVLDVDDRYTMKGVKKDERAAYFDAIRRERDNGGVSGFLHYLLHYDISKFDVRDVPSTEALASQKLAGLRGVYRWWSEILLEGDLPFDNYDKRGPRYSLGDWRADWISAPTDDIYDAYVRWHKEHRFQGEITGKSQVFRSLKEMLPDLKKIQYRKESDGSRIYFNKLPDLAECREFFEGYLNSEIDWSGDDLDEVEVWHDTEDDFDNLGPDEDDEV